MGTLSVDKILKTSTGAAEFTLPATDGTANQVMQTDGSGQLSFGSSLPTDSVTATQIAAGAVGSSEIATDAVDTAEIAANAVTTTEIVDDAVTIAKLAATGTASATTFLRGDNAWTAIETGTSWQAVKTAAFTAVAGNGYWIDTTSNACTVTLPAAASVGDQIVFRNSNKVENEAK